MIKKFTIAMTVAISAILLGCGSAALHMEAVTLEPEPAAPVTYTIPDVPIPLASGINISENDKAVIDFSNARDGYVMVKPRLNGDARLKVLTQGPSGTEYTYVLRRAKDYEVLPLSDGDGKYTVGVYEQIEGMKYALALSEEIDVALTDPLSPFLRPNQYVDFDRNSEAVRKGAELVAGLDDVMDKISAIYNFVVDNFTYDENLAENVQSGYLPDIDAVLASRTGICFDYSAVMTAMLRSQGIPAKLAIGYIEEGYHAWICVYSEDGGWINNIISFDGNSWSLMDPTLASTSQNDPDMLRFITDESNYTIRFQY